MRWQIEHLVFCDLQQTLTDNQNVEQLEPMVVELLSYFCQHPARIISRDELVEKVWLGRIITDNAVNRVVTKLRKVLSDNPKQPQFIATFPKKGYKLIVTPVRLQKEESSEDQLSADMPTLVHSEHYQTNRKWFLNPLLLTGTLFVLLLVVALSISQFHSKVTPISNIKALTRGAGQESQPQISPDLKYLAFVEFNDDKMRSKIKSLADETEIEINHGEKNSVWVGSPSWSDDGEWVVYLVTTPDSCQYYLSGFNQLRLTEPKLIHNCPAGSYGKIDFTHDNNRLIYAESEGPDTPFSLFELTLDSGKKRRLNQPELFIGGNSQFDIHPFKNKLLISSPDKQQWEGFYSLDLETDELKLMFKQDAYICCGIWDHQGERVVLMGEHPAYQLVSYNLAGKDRTVIYSGGQQIRAPERHANGKDYLLVAGRANMNALYYNPDSKIAQMIADSTVDDRLARFAYHNSQIAYISVASGHEEIWLTDSSGKKARKLTQFSDRRHYIDLLWSYRGDFLLGLALNEIHIINTQTGRSEKLKLSQYEIRGVSLKSENVISFSSKIENQWRVTYYDIDTHAISYEEPQWAYVRHSNDSSDSWWIDQRGHLYQGSDKQLVTDSTITGVEPLIGRLFNLKKFADTWYWQEFSQGSFRLKSKVVGQAKSVKAISDSLILENSSHSYDLSSHGILYHQAEISNADIYTSVQK